MRPSNYAKAAFHGTLDRYTWAQPTLQPPTRGTTHTTIQEREVSYRFTLHAHHYVGELVQRLLRRSTAGLQAADTDYAGTSRSAPQSVRIAVPANSALTVPAGTRIELVADTVAQPPVPAVNLAARMQFKLTNAVPATLAGGAEFTLIDGLDPTPPRQTQFALPAAMGATAAGATEVVLGIAAGITLHDGNPGVLPAATHVRVLADAPLDFAAGTQATLLSSARLPVLYAGLFASASYGPTPLVHRPYPVRDLDFTPGGAYSVYNWELFFHIPLAVAIHLSKNQRYADAQRWLHFLFDPTDDSDGPTPQRFWKVRPFQSTDVKKVEEILVNLATGEDEELRRQTVNSISAWRAAPFRPHVVARYRQQAYMYKAVMTYLDNLIAWGDSLFRQDTGEAIDEARMLYVLAAGILGPRPQAVPKKGSVRPQNYDNLRADLDLFGNAMRGVESEVPFDLAPFPADASADDEKLYSLRSLGKALYFGVPRNDKLVAYWDTVADRLFKIRNSLSLQGVFRQLALFEPPIDPAMLARAAAAGLDVAAVVAGLSQPLPLVRFQLLLQKALEACQAAQSLGGQLLTAMEKEDGEAMLLLRARHERAILQAGEQVKYTQLQETIKAREGLQASIESAIHRYAWNELHLGRTLDEILKTIPPLADFKLETLEKMNFAAAEPHLSPRGLNVAIDAGTPGDEAAKHLSAEETSELAKLADAHKKNDDAKLLDKIGGGLAIIPSFSANLQPLGCGASISFGGGNLASMMSLMSSFGKGDAETTSYEAGRAGKMAGYGRRQEDYVYQSGVALLEVNTIYKQLRAAQLREAAASMELANHKAQIKNAQEIEHFLNESGSFTDGKKTHQALYAWMKREVRGLYANSFQLAFDMARKAERALQHELGKPDLTFVQYGYLAGNEGLLAGEKLHLDLKRMEHAYLELNQREYEMTRHASLQQIDPLALMQLRATGRCRVALPESLFDMDAPGQYFRRIKSVALSIPCVTGSYSSVNCTLTLLKSSTRKSALVGDGYERLHADDDRFDDYFGSTQSVVTSSAQNDSGMFETNLRDERLLPFEYCGAVSEWQLELPANPVKGQPQQFDYETISDVILHLRYTAREGGGLLRQAALDQFGAAIGNASAVGSLRLFSVRHDFPGEWAKFQTQTPAAGQRFELALTLRPEHYPYWSRGRLSKVNELILFARSARSPMPTSLDLFDNADPAAAGAKDVLVRDAGLGNLLTGGLKNIARPAQPASTVKLAFADRTLEDLWLAVRWS